MFSSYSGNGLTISMLLKQKHTLRTLAIKLERITLGKKRISASVSGSLTVEAALMLPLFIFLLSCFLYLGQVLLIQTRLQEAMESTGEEAAVYRYGMEVLKNTGEENENPSIGNMMGELLIRGLHASWVKNEIVERAGRKFLDYSCIRGGSEGIRLLNSEELEENSIIDLIVYYQIEIPLGVKLSFTQRCRRKSWIGSNEIVSETEQKVYITENGTVYHCDRNCTYILHKINPVLSGEIQAKRNQSGARYYPCESCSGRETAERVYITPNGNRYHNKLTCSKITPAVRTIPVSEIGSRPSCSKCGT